MTIFCKTILAAALTSVTLASAQAAEPITVYGKLNVTVQSNDVDGTRKTSIQSNASRFGVKGAYELGDSLEAFYIIEYEVDTGDDSKDNFEARHQFVGLRGDFGSVALGRSDTMLKRSQGKVDLFSDLSGDIKSLFKGENRLAQTATYITPKYNGFQFGISYVAEDSAAQEVRDEKGDLVYSTDGYSMAAMYGDAKLKTSPIFASIAYDADVKGYEILRATVQGKLAGVKLGAMYQQQEKAFSASGKLSDQTSTQGFLVSAAYTIDAVTLKTQYQDMEDKGDSWTVGADYKLGKPTKLLAFYTNRSLDGHIDDDSYLALGIEHKF